MKSHLFGQQFMEKQTDDAWVLQNERMLKVRLNGEFLARQGSMVAYQGDVGFEFKGAGAKRLIKKMVTGEDLQLMRVHGQGEVFLGKWAEEVHLVYLENDGITLNGENVLAFDANLNWDIKFNKGVSGMLGQGLTNVVIQGTGWVAVTSYGTPVVLETGQQATYADPSAAIAWSSNLVTEFKKNDSALKTLIGRGGGELFTMGFQGQGYVIIQPSEGNPASFAAVSNTNTGGGIGSLLS
jgi:uncharacterized protein (AIM24 family)